MMSGKQNDWKLIDKAARLVGQRANGARMNDLGGVPENLSHADWFIQAWQAVGLSGKPHHVSELTPAHLPALAWHSDGRALILLGRSATGVWRAETLNGEVEQLNDLAGLQCLVLPHRGQAAVEMHGALKRVLLAMVARKGIFVDAAVATAVCNLLTLGTSLFSMQVYDRVIPNHGFQTLMVLSVGVVVAVVLEFVLKQVRSRSVDRACMAIDEDLSGWFFQRMMGIRMESRPASVGTLASQVKGFEMVRGVLASTSLFVLTDVPFAIFFIAVIGLVAGWLVLIPLLAVPIALLAGLGFQRLIQRHTRSNIVAGNRKAGLLVEAVDGAESLKANSAEWTMLGRWNRLAVEAGESDFRARSHSGLSQNLTVALQQLSYVALVAVGAWMVANNELTMGGLLACTIISNRAMLPIVQLPGVMVQWAHASAAVEGLDQIIGLPNEADEAENTLAPQALPNGLRFERIRFVYGLSDRPALELPNLDIKPGQRVGLVGSIGSGKSTLLKLASAMYRPTEGKVFLGGMDLAMIAPAVARENIGYLPQDARLFSGTLRENLLQGLPDPGDEAILSAAQRTGLIELIAGQPKGLALPITEGGRGVSGGQKQLIMLTRTLLANPKVWVLDEPTGAMDSMTEARVVQLLGEVAATGATLIAATHKTALLPLFDRLIILQNGRILADGPRDAVLAKMSGKPPVNPQEARV